MALSILSDLFDHQPKYRYFIELAFKGSAYHGWQIQKNACSVQQIVNETLAILLKHRVETIGCGRTDAGVHAKRFYAHFDSALELDTQDAKLMFSLNALLPCDIAAKRIIKVSAEAHARFDATLRSYEYQLHFNKDPFLHDCSWFLRDHPDVVLMNQAAKILSTYRDFSCFSKSNTQTFTNNCVIYQAEWMETTTGLVFHISADRFLRNMVRAIVGTLLQIGRKAIEVQALHAIIQSKDRTRAGSSVPAVGLSLTEVIYPYLPHETPTSHH